MSSEYRFPYLNALVTLKLKPANCYSVAKDRAWFRDYTPYESVVGDLYGMVKESLGVEGIGTVELLTKRSPNRSGRDSYGILCLTNVLHVPSALCNIIGGLILEDYKVTAGPAGKASLGSIKDRKGRSVAYFDSCRYIVVKKRNLVLAFIIAYNKKRTGDISVNKFKWVSS